MPTAIEIADVHLTEMTADEMTPLMAQSGVSWYRLAIPVRNRSAAPVHVISDIRRYRRDAGRRTLVLELSESPASEPSIRRRVPPRYLTIEAGGQVTLVHPLSSPITFLSIADDGSRQSTYVRIPEDVDSIECVVSYDTEPPPPAADITAAPTSMLPRKQQRTVTGSWKGPRSKKTGDATPD